MILTAIKFKRTKDGNYEFGWLIIQTAKLDNIILDSTGNILNEVYDSVSLKDVFNLNLTNFFK